MSRICSLFDVPPAVGYCASQRQILVSPEYTAAVSDGGTLAIFSISANAMVGNFANVECIQSIELTFMKNPVIAVLSDETLSLMSFGGVVPEARPFDESRRIASFSVARLNETIFKICEFEMESRILSLLPSTANSLLLLDKKGFLQKITFFPDGAYKGKTVSAEGCEKFTWTGLYLVGASPNAVHVWTSGLEHISQIDIASSLICSIDFGKVGVITGKRMTVIDLVTNNKTERLLEREVPFVAIVDDEIVYPPSNTTVSPDCHFLPLFVGEKSVFTVNSEVYIERVLSTFPILVARKVLKEIHGESCAGRFIAENAVKTGNVGIIERFLENETTETCVVFIRDLDEILCELNDVSFGREIFPTVAAFCAKNIEASNCADELLSILMKMKNFVCPVQSVVVPKSYVPDPDITKIGEDQLRAFVRDSLNGNEITKCLYVLEASFPDFEPFTLFRRLILQEAWCCVCERKMADAEKLLESLGDKPIDQFREMWRQTTRKDIRRYLFDKIEKDLSTADRENDKRLRSRESQNTRFEYDLQSSGRKYLSSENWEPKRPLDKDFREQDSMIFGHLFSLPEEPKSSDPVTKEYFVGNIALMEVSANRETGDLEELWKAHCDFREFNKLQKKFMDDPKLGKSFLDRYYTQLNTFELESIADGLCEKGIFCDFEMQRPDLFVARVANNNRLFDIEWWKQQELGLFEKFTRAFAEFCGRKKLFLPFGEFIKIHRESPEFLRVMEKIATPGDSFSMPLPLKFMWELVGQRLGPAALAWAQYKADSTSTEFTELWPRLERDALSPLLSYFWNTDPSMFRPGSPEATALSNRLRVQYPFLASLVTGRIPSPTPHPNEPESQWRSPLWTSKCDLELHDVIQDRFGQYDFLPIFTDEYGKRWPDHPKFPTFEHPDVVNEGTEPFEYYVKSKIPVSTFQQALNSGVDEEGFKDLCLRSMKEAFGNRDMRLSTLSFIELVDMKFGSSMAIDYKLCLALYDKLFSSDNDTLIYQLSVIFTRKDKDAAKSIERKIMPDSLELYLICVLLRVRCGLELDMTPIVRFASNADVQQLLEFVDRSIMLGAHYSMKAVVKTVQERMPESNLKAHLLFYLSHSLPTEEGPASGETPLALVVFHAMNTPEPVTSLLKEALDRKDQVYGFLATAIEGCDLMLCAYVIMLTMSDGHETLESTVTCDQFIYTVERLLNQKKSLELMQSLELFGKDIICVQLIYFYRAVELFAFTRAETVLAELNAVIAGKETLQDKLLGEVPVSLITDVLSRMIDSLSKYCEEKSQIHVFRFLELLHGSRLSPFIESRVKLCQTISQFSDFKRAIVHTNLLGEPQQIVSDLVINHSLALGNAAAETLGVSSEAATEQWLAFKYSMASTPAQVLEIHNEVVESVTAGDPMFMVCVFVSLLPYADPTVLMPILEYARKIFTGDPKFLRKIDAVLLHLSLCKQYNITLSPTTAATPSLTDIFNVVFPSVPFPSVQRSMLPNITSNVLFGLDALESFFNGSVDDVIDICLEKTRVEDAYLLCEWRNQNPENIERLEAIQLLLAGESLTNKQENLLRESGDPSNMQALLDSLARKVGWRFVLLSLHYRASTFLGVPTSNLTRRKTAEFVESSLSVTTDQWPLVRELIQASQMSANQVAASLSASFFEHVKKVISMGVPARQNQLAIDDYGEQYLEFTKLCALPNAVGDKLFEIVRKSKQDLPLAVTVNLLLHASTCASDIDECADLCDTLLDTLTNENQIELLMDIVCIFPEPALLPRFFQYLIAQQKLDELPPSKLNEKVGRVIMNCARHVHPFDPHNYFDLTLKYNLYRDHAELQMQCGLALLVGTPDKLKLHDASRHFLLALAYFLHEKCYSLSMECLKKLSLISLQMESPEPLILRLEQHEVLQLMCQKEFPFALTLAVAYDMDTESSWAEAIYEHTVVAADDEFLTTFQFYRPITSELCDGVVRKYKASKQDEEQQNRMKTFINNVPNLVERYRISKSLEFVDQIEHMKKIYPVVCEWCERAFMGQR